MRRRRNRVCLGLIVLGLLNIAVYTMVYALIGGDAWNGGIHEGQHYVSGHFIRSVEGRPTPVSKGVWVYSYVHSITIWPSLAIIVLSMLILARPHIMATCRGDRISGGLVVTVIAAVVVILTAVGTIALTTSFIAVLSRS